MPSSLIWFANCANVTFSEATVWTDMLAGFVDPMKMAAPNWPKISSMTETNPRNSNSIVGRYLY